MIRSITEDSRRATVRWKQPWRWGASCIPTKYQLRHAERAINGASVLIRRRGNGRLCFDPYESACNLTARRGAAVQLKKGDRLVGKGRTCADTQKDFLRPCSLRAPWLASCRDRCVSWNEGRLCCIWYCGLTQSLRVFYTFVQSFCYTPNCTRVLQSFFHFFFLL